MEASMLCTQRCVSCSSCGCGTPDSAPNSGGIPLSTARAGSRGTIVRISGKDEVRRHLFCLGFTVGEEVCVHSVVGGNMILAVRGSKIAMDRTLVSKIMYDPE